MRRSAYDMRRAKGRRGPDMSVFDHPEFDHHEAIHFFDDPKTGLRAIVAIHSTALGPAAGGPSAVE